MARRRCTVLPQSTLTTSRISISCNRSSRTMFSQRPKNETLPFDTWVSAIIHFVTHSSHQTKGFIVVTDSDGHFVTISNDDNFQLALKSATDGPLHPLKLYIKLQGSVYGMNDELASCKGAVHDGVLCDECDGAIMGFRYKCIECPDFDLCGQCESGAVHAAHVMLRVSESTAVHGRLNTCPVM